MHIETIRPNVSTGKHSWWWPDDDTELRRVADDLSALKRALELHRGEYQCAVQAGGAAGVWAVALARVFRVVETFEPNPVWLQALVANTSDIPGLMVNALALSDERSMCYMALNDGQAPGNLGAMHIVKTTEFAPCMSVTLDSRKLWPDFIALDIEGHEAVALAGARETISTHRPTILVEQNMNNDAVDYLVSEFNYTVEDRVGNDVILLP